MLMLLLTILATLAAPAAPRSCFRSEPRNEVAVRAVEDRWVRLLQERDVPGLTCLLAPDFADINWAGQILSRTAVLAALPRRPDMRLSLSQIRVSLHGNIAIAHGLNHQIDAAGKPFGAVRFTDILLYRGGRWQAISAQETPVREMR